MICFLKDFLLVVIFFSFGFMLYCVLTGPSSEFEREELRKYRLAKKYGKYIIKDEELEND
jgi:hypothetical protein